MSDKPDDSTRAKPPDLEAAIIAQVERYIAANPKAQHDLATKGYHQPFGPSGYDDDYDWDDDGEEWVRGEPSPARRREAN